VNADQILEHVDDPPVLEALYRESPVAFRGALEEALSARPDDVVLRVWAARLAEPPRKELPTRGLGLAIAIGLGSGLLVRLPAVWLGEEWYYPRFWPSIVVLGLALYFWAQKRDRGRLILGAALASGAGVFVSLLPDYTDSVTMALVHLPVLLWTFLGLAFTGSDWRDTDARILFLRYNGELLILGSLVALGGFVFSGITVALFELASEGAGEWYAENVGVLGAAALPVAATYLYDSVFRRHTGIPSVLARVFAPLFLVMTCAYLAIALVVGQNPFLDREFLITVNGLLLVVLGMTVLSIAERGEEDRVNWIDRTHVALLAVTLLIDVLALSAILFRLASYGFTPNRVVVLGANLVILVHLSLIGRAQLGFVRGTRGIREIRAAAAGYLPTYGVWAAGVCFVLPLVFRFT
jgi:hypothetical protein